MYLSPDVLSVCENHSDSSLPQDPTFSLFFLISEETLGSCGVPTQTLLLTTLTKFLCILPHLSLVSQSASWFLLTPKVPSLPHAYAPKYDKILKNVKVIPMISQFFA